MKNVIKNAVGIMVATPLVGVALDSIGNASSKMSGLGPATQTMVSAGYLGKIIKMKW